MSRDNESDYMSPAMQASFELARGANSVPLTVRQEILDVNKAVVMTVANDGDVEPNLSMPIMAGYKSTWGEKKSLCKIEAHAAWELGASIADNPYIKDTWPNKWWSEFFFQRSGPRNKTVVSIIN